jgi:hypothetical protein
MGGVKVVDRCGVLHGGDPKGGSTFPPGGAPHSVGDDQ